MLRMNDAYHPPQLMLIRFDVRISPRNRRPNRLRRITFPVHARGEHPPQFRHAFERWLDLPLPIRKPHLPGKTAGSFFLHHPIPESHPRPVPHGPQHPCPSLLFRERLPANVSCDHRISPHRRALGKILPPVPPQSQPLRLNQRHFPTARNKSHHRPPHLEISTRNLLPFLSHVPPAVCHVRQGIRTQLRRFVLIPQLPRLRSAACANDSNITAPRHTLATFIPCDHRSHRRERFGVRHHGAPWSFRLQSHSAASDRVRRRLRPAHAQRPVVASRHQHVRPLRADSSRPQHVVPLESWPRRRAPPRALLLPPRVPRQRHFWQHRQCLLASARRRSRRLGRHLRSRRRARFLCLFEEDARASPDQQQNAQQPRHLHRLQFDLRRGHPRHQQRRPPRRPHHGIRRWRAPPLRGSLRILAPYSPLPRRRFLGDRAVRLRRRYQTVPRRDQQARLPGHPAAAFLSL